MTTRRWMIAVAIVATLMAVGFEAARATRRAREYRVLANSHAAFRDIYFREAYRVHHAAVDRAAGDSSREMGLLVESHQRALAWYHHALAVKYRRAALYPWLPVEPDPPAPE
jgi:hypothetical protein